MFTTPFTRGTTKQDLSATRTKIRIASFWERNFPSSTLLLPHMVENAAAPVAEAPAAAEAPAIAVAGDEKLTAADALAAGAILICGGGAGGRTPPERPALVLSTTFLNFETLR